MALSVQYGCGLDAPDGWLNFDSSPTLRIQRIPLLGSFYGKKTVPFPRTVRYGDIVKGLPVPRNSVARLYASHVLEHLAYEDALRAIDNSFSILEPGGVFRLIVPDLATRARRYLEGNARAEPGAAEEFMESTVLGERARRRGPMGLMTAAFGASKHRWMWDTASMTKALADAGFVEIRRCRCGDSNDPLFALVEQPARFFEGADEELALTCRKPA